MLPDTAFRILATPLKKTLIQELEVDGLIVEAKHDYCFAHQSFQEFLAAQHLVTPNPTLINKVLREYLLGDDWWREVIRFYIGLIRKPEDLTDWLIAKSGKTMNWISIVAG